MLDNGELSGFGRQVAVYEAKFPYWQDVQIPAQFGDKPVTITQIAQRWNRDGTLEAVRVAELDMTFVWGGEVDETTRQAFLDEGYLVAGVDAYIPLVRAFEEKAIYTLYVGKC